jgi:hypothetical protein
MQMGAFEDAANRLMRASFEQMEADVGYVESLALAARKRMKEGDLAGMRYWMRYAHQALNERSLDILFLRNEAAIHMLTLY